METETEGSEESAGEDADPDPEGIKPGFLERVLGLVTEVQSGEAPTALLMALNAFLILMAYSTIKPVREALILAHPGGAEYKVYMGGATAALLIFAVPLYSRLTRHAPRNRLVVGVTLFFASHLLLFFGYGQALGSSLPFALVFYLWIAIFNMMIVAQFWAFANDIYGEEAGKRLFPLIGLGASVGGVAGAGAAVRLIKQIGPLGMMLVAASLLVGSAAIVQWVHRREVRRALTQTAQANAERPIGGTFGKAFSVVFAQRYLLLIAVFSVVFTLVKTNGDYILAHIVSRDAAQAVAGGSLQAAAVTNHIGRFYAGYEFWINVTSLAIQALLVSRLVKYLGVSGAFYILPIVALGDAAIMLAFPLLAAVRFGKTAESALDYSLNNTVRNMLWLRTSRRAKYLGKQAVDTFFVRLGDVSSALLVYLAIRALGASVRQFAAVNVVLVIVWLVLVRAINKERARLPEEPEEENERAVGEKYSVA